jgi:hypothetical protein
MKIENKKNKENKILKNNKKWKKQLDLLKKIKIS